MAAKKKAEILVAPELVEAVINSAATYAQESVSKPETRALSIVEGRGKETPHLETSSKTDEVFFNLRIFFTGILVGAMRRNLLVPPVSGILGDIPLTSTGRAAVNEYVAAHPLLRITVDAIQHNAFGITGWQSTVQRLVQRASKGDLPENFSKEILSMYSEVSNVFNLGRTITTEFLGPLVQIISAQLLSASGGPTVQGFAAQAKFQTLFSPINSGLDNTTYQQVLAMAFLHTVEHNFEQMDEEALDVVVADVPPMMVGGILFAKIKSKPASGGMKFG